jgi:DNA-binding transcriptional LysR family regulator
MLDLRRLAIFHEVAARGSFSGAALALNFTQSVVSHHVAALEAELGLSLFERGRRPVRLTPAGERLSQHALGVLGAARAAEADMRALAGLETGALRLGAFLSACATFVPVAIGALEAAHPDFEVRLEQHEPPRALSRLVAGELDVAVVFREQHDARLDPRLESVHLADDPYRLALAPGHRLAKRRRLGLADLRAERFAAPRLASGGIAYRRMVEDLCAGAGFAPDFAYEVDDVTVARTFVAAGLCVAVLPDMTIPSPRPDVLVRDVREIATLRTVHAVWVRGRAAPGLAPTVDALRRASAAER